MTLKKLTSIILSLIIVLPLSVLLAFAQSTENIIDGVLKEYNGNEKMYFIPDSVRIVEENAFGECVGLEEIYIGNNVEIIGSNAFTSCQNLKIICFAATNSVVIGENIANENVMILVNNDNKNVRKSIAVSDYKWSSFSTIASSGKKILMFNYEADINVGLSECGKKLINENHPDYIYFNDSNVYFISENRNANEIDYSKTSNPGLLVKIGVAMKIWNMPDKADVESGNDGAKNGIKRLLNAIFKSFK